MTIAANNTIAKVAAVVAGFGLVAMSFAPVAKADSSSDLNAQIQSLLAQVASLQAQLGSSQGAGASVMFSKDLTIGSKGADVTALQNWLIKGGYSIPAGATGTFGAQTKAAVMAYQSAKGITPASGFFGPKTRAMVNASAGSTGGTTTGGTSTGSTGLSGKEATISGFDLVSEQGSLKENMKDVKVATARFDVTGGDINVQRADLEVQATNASSYDVKPWKYIDSVSVWDGSKRLATVDASSQDSWDDNTADANHTASSAKFYKVSLTGFNDVVKNGEKKHELTFTVNTKTSIDKSTGVGQNFKIDVPDQGIRAMDPVGINQYTGSVSDKVTLTVDSAANGNLTISKDSTTPLAGVLVADTTDTTDNLTVLVFKVRNTDNADTKLTDMTFTVATSSATGSAAKDVTSIVRKATLMIDGKSYDATVNAGTLVFNDMTAVVPSNGSVTGTVKVSLYGQTSHYASSGESLTLSLASTGVTAEGALSGDVLTSSKISGTVTGNTQSIAVNGGINVAGKSNTAVLTYNSTSPASSYGTYTLKFDVTAVGDDVYVPKTISSTSADVASTTSHYGVVVDQTVSGTAFTGTSTQTLTTTAQSDNSLFYVVRAGTTESFTATVTLDPNTTGDFAVGLDKIRFSTTDTDLNSLQLLNTDAFDAQFHTDPLHVPNS